MKKISYTVCLLLLTFLFGAVPMVRAAGTTEAGGRLYLSPESGVHQVGEPFVVSVLADTGGQVVNAIEGELSYNPSDFAVETISTDNSILTSWSTAPSYDGAAGIIKFSGWAGEQYSGKDGLLIAVTLLPLRVVQSTITFNGGAMLAADGRGSNIITAMSSGAYAVSPKQITPPAPLTPTATSTDVVTPTLQKPQGEPSSAPVSTTSLVGSEQAASLISSGVELAPVLALFFTALILIAFCIAYILHRTEVR